jgi:hypothetical protein
MTIQAERITHEQAVRDPGEAERAAAAFLTALGLDITSASLAETPARMARAYAELLTPRDFALTTFDNDEGYDELSWPARSRSARSASTTCCRSSASPTSGTCPASASSGCPSWPGSSSCSPTGPRCRNA